MTDKFEPTIIGFTCNWCSYRAADLAGTARMKYAPNVRLIRMMCSGRLDPTFVLRALAGGADGVDSGVYMTTPLSRLNASEGMATPRAQEEYERFYSLLGGKPVHKRLATHWARLTELLYAAERWVELATDPELTSPNVHTRPTQIPTEGIGIVEAPRGTRTLITGRTSAAS